MEELLKNQPEWVQKNIIFACQYGSHLYGTSTPDSDKDYRCITIAPIDFYVGGYTFNNLDRQTDEADLTVFEIRKFINLVSATNPNVCELLFVEQGNPNIITWTPAWEQLRPKMRSLISQEIYRGFYGYATSQLSKMMIKQANKTGRVSLAEQFGYDTKFVMHAIRLIDQGIELLTTGQMTFPRPNADFLLAIRNGKVFKDKEEAERFFFYHIKKLEAIKDHSILPKVSDVKFKNLLLIEIFKKYVYI